MLFTGSSEHTIDAKQRLAIPAKYRQARHENGDSGEGAAWYCFPWATGQLRLYSEELFTRLAQPRDEDARLAPDPDIALLKSRLFGMTERLDMDSAGRVQIPRIQMELIGLTSEVAVVGAGDHLEVWDRSAWKAAYRNNVTSLPELVQRIQSKGLRTF